MLQQASSINAISAVPIESPNIMIDVRNLVKSYNHKTAVNNVSFAVKQGEIFGVLGPNGAGKTTTLEMIEGIRTPDSGTAILAGLDIRRQKRAVQRIIGVQLQATALFPELTLLETLRFFSSIYPKGMDPRQLLSEVRLEEKARDHPQNLSGKRPQSDLPGRTNCWTGSTEPANVMGYRPQTARARQDNSYYNPLYGRGSNLM